MTFLQAIFVCSVYWGISTTINYLKIQAEMKSLKDRIVNNILLLDAPKDKIDRFIADVFLEK